MPKKKTFQNIYFRVTSYQSPSLPLPPSLSLSLILYVSSSDIDSFVLLLKAMLVVHNLYQTFP